MPRSGAGARGVAMAPHCPPGESTDIAIRIVPAWMPGPLDGRTFLQHGAVGLEHRSVDRGHRELFATASETSMGERGRRRAFERASASERPNDACRADSCSTHGHSFRCHVDGHREYTRGPPVRSTTRWTATRRSNRDVDSGSLPQPVVLTEIQFDSRPISAEGWASAGRHLPARLSSRCQWTARRSAPAPRGQGSGGLQ